MKKYTIICMLSAAGSFIIAAEPIVALKLNEGSGTKLTAAGKVGAHLKVGISNPENIEWKKGRDGEPAIFFKKPENPRKSGCVTLKKDGKIDFTQPFTLTCWVNIAPGTRRESSYEIFSDALGDRGPGFRLRYTWNMLWVSSDNAKDPKVASPDRWTLKTNPSKSPIELGVWNHVAVIFDGKSAKLYLNGSKITETSPKSGAGVAAGHKSDCYIGSYRDGSAYAFPGAISDVKIYDCALGDGEIMTEAKELDD